MTKLKGPVTHAGVGLQGNRHFVRSAGDHLPVFDRTWLKAFVAVDKATASWSREKQKTYHRDTKNKWHSWVSFHSPVVLDAPSAPFRTGRSVE